MKNIKNVLKKKKLNSIFKINKMSGRYSLDSMHRACSDYETKENDFTFNSFCKELIDEINKEEEVEEEINEEVTLEEIP